MLVRTLIPLCMLVVASTLPVSAQTVGTCDHGEAEADLDVNNVWAQVYNNGMLFYRSGSRGNYVVPSDGLAQPIFAAGIWIGGLDDDGELRFAGTAYGPFEYWPGPLDDFGNPPPDCSDYDRIYSVYKSDLAELNSTGVATSDILNWPHELGAPVVDGDGVRDNYNLEGGDRPKIQGDQMLWWIMNDVGNTKLWTLKDPIGLEIRVSVYAFTDSTSLNNVTFYNYRLTNKGLSGFNDAFFGFHVDSDLGNASDDFVGSDSILGLAFTYNGQDFDPGTDGYGERPPALGIDYLSGPVNPDAPENRIQAVDRLKGRSLQMTTFLAPFGDGSVIGNAEGRSSDPYYYLKGIWRDGTPMTFGGNSYGGSIQTSFLWTGNPAKREYWSEENSDNAGSRNTPADRYFIASTGPFMLAPGETQDITFAIVWSRSSSRLASVAKLYEDDVYIQGLYDRGWIPQPVIDAPVLSHTTTGNNIVLHWENPPSSDNHQESFDERSGFVYNKLGEDPDLTYTFEGYDVIQYVDEQDSVGTVIATYDVVNNIKGVAEERFDHESDIYITEVTARGNDNGVAHEHFVGGLTNYQTYHFGVRAYAYNERSLPKVHRGPVSRITVVPGEETSSLTTSERLGSIGITPNPYVGTSDYEVNNIARRVRFTALPERATIRVFTVAGTLVRRLDKNDPLTHLDWDLLTDEGRRIGSGIYLIHITAPGLGERVIKFGHVGRD